MCSDFPYKSISCGYLLELPRLVQAIQMSTHNLCYFTEVDNIVTEYEYISLLQPRCGSRLLWRHWLSDWLFYEVKQRRPRLVPGWVIVVLDFVNNPVSHYNITQTAI